MRVFLKLAPSRAIELHHNTRLNLFLLHNSRDKQLTLWHIVPGRLNDTKVFKKVFFCGSMMHFVPITIFDHLTKVSTDNLARGSKCYFKWSWISIIWPGRISTLWSYDWNANESKYFWSSDKVVIWSLGQMIEMLKRLISILCFNLVKFDLLTCKTRISILWKKWNFYLVLYYLIFLISCNSTIYYCKEL